MSKWLLHSRPSFLFLSAPHPMSSSLPFLGTSPSPFGGGSAPPPSYRSGWFPTQPPPVSPSNSKSPFGAVFKGGSTNPFLAIQPPSSSSMMPPSTAPLATTTPTIVYQIEKKDLHELAEIIKRSAAVTSSPSADSLDSLTPYLDAPSTKCDVCAMEFSASNQKKTKGRRFVCVTCKDLDLCAICHAQILHAVGNGNLLPEAVELCLQKHRHNPAKCIMIPIYSSDHLERCVQIRAGLQGRGDL